MSPTSKMVANVHERTSIDGWHERLGHPSLRIVQHLVKNFSPPIVTKKIFLNYVVHAPLIKHINNLFIPIVFKVMHHLNLFILMFGDLHIITTSTNLVITSFWLTTSQIHVVLSNGHKIRGVYNFSLLQKTCRNTLPNQNKKFVL